MVNFDLVSYQVVRESNLHKLQSRIKRLIMQGFEELGKVFFLPPGLSDSKKGEYSQVMVKKNKEDLNNILDSPRAYSL